MTEPKMINLSEMNDKVNKLEVSIDSVTNGQMQIVEALKALVGKERTLKVKETYRVTRNGVRYDSKTGEAKEILIGKDNATPANILEAGKTLATEQFKAVAGRISEIRQNCFKVSVKTANNRQIHFWFLPMLNKEGYVYLGRRGWTLVE